MITAISSVKAGRGDTTGGDLFGDLFGRVGGRSRARSNARGQNVEATLELTLEEAHRGGRRTLQMQVGEICPTCQGNGTINNGKDKDGLIVCPTCQGSGQVSRAKTIEVNIPTLGKSGREIARPSRNPAGNDCWREMAPGFDLMLVQ